MRSVVGLREYGASSIADLCNAIVAITQGFEDSRAWWRGQANAAWQLVPSLYRLDLAPSESNLNARFKLMAPARRSNCPGPGDAFGWLFLMQHYCLPTRLLDWSESPLVALFFALEECADAQADCALWVLMPTKMNLQDLGREAILMPGSPDLRTLAIEAFVRNSANPDIRTLAVLTEQSDLRHLVQQSAFTIHGSSSPIELMPGTDDFLVRIRIPAAARVGLHTMLALLGVSRATLFPDLDHLALELAALEFGQLA